MISDIVKGYVKSEKHGGITTIEFFHPQSNSLPIAMLDDLVKEFHSAGHDEETKVIVLRSVGELAFCAGASFDELTAIHDASSGLKFFSGFANLINAMRKCPQFIITRVQGKCVGGGLSLVSASDYVIAMDSAEVRLSELSLGIGPFVVGPPLERKMGHSAFSQLAIDANLWRTAEWAKRTGLYAEVHSETEVMDESIRRLTHNLAHANPLAMKEMKKILWHDTDHWDQLLHERAAISGKLALSDFTRDALAKIRKKG